jgi:hypothetical protein
MKGIEVPCAAAAARSKERQHDVGFKRGDRIMDGSRDLVVIP